MSNRPHDLLPEGLDPVWNQQALLTLQVGCDDCEEHVHQHIPAPAGRLDLAS